VFEGATHGDNDEIHVIKNKKQEVLLLKKTGFSFITQSLN
jgi:hypothetical protein